jgi:mRNA-degrading endonuclease RelE of RelBE toxin-antitoxin system
MNKIDKFLAKIDQKTRLLLEQIIFRILKNEIDNLDVKKLRGKKDMYRVRIGNIRILFEKHKGKNFLHDLSYRSEQTYSVK